MCLNQMMTKKIKNLNTVEFELTTLVGICTYYIGINNVFYPDIRSPPCRPQKTVFFDIIVTINGVVCVKK